MHEQETLIERKGTEMHFNGMRRSILKNDGWYERPDGSWEIDYEGHTYYLSQEEDGLFVITTDSEQIAVSYSFTEVLTDFWG